MLEPSPSARSSYVYRQHKGCYNVNIPALRKRAHSGEPIQPTGPNGLERRPEWARCAKQNLQNAREGVKFLGIRSGWPEAGPLGPNGLGRSSSQASPFRLRPEWARSGPNGLEAGPSGLEVGPNGLEFILCFHILWLLGLESIL